MPIAQSVLDDLRRRLSDVRWPAGVTDSGGVPLAEAKEFVRYWRDDFDWRAQEQRIAAFHHHKRNGIHFIHEKSGRPPLVLLHGWPGSFLEFLRVIPLITDTFDVIVPSLPGYGFSDPPFVPGTSNREIANQICGLMTLLGYDQFAVQGGDWGAGISTWIARDHPERLTAMHLNYIPGSYAPHAENLTDDEQQFLRDAADWEHEFYAYGHVQKTRPLTLGYALADSPAGLGLWIWEKFREWADPRSNLPLDDILANITLYWATNTITSSMRLYLESTKTPLRFAQGERLATPCAVAHFPLEAPFPPRSWIERVYSVQHWSEFDAGGHFAAMEQPEAFAEDLKTAFGRIV
ncbi:MAG TPA: epoxide hydrolase [Thermoanaerobaculia bacterium]|nr:epoxide hydrolase [Thermoanaerobaculia bacterium]